MPKAVTFLARGRLPSPLSLVQPHRLLALQSRLWCTWEGHLLRSSARPPHLPVRHSSAPGHTAPTSPSTEVSAFLQQAQGQGSGSARGCLLLMLLHPFLHLCSFPALQKPWYIFASGHCRVPYGLVLGDCGHLTNINRNEEDWGTHGERQKHSWLLFFPPWLLLTTVKFLR